MGRHKLPIIIIIINLPPALLAEWPGSFTCHCSNMGVEWALNKSQHTKLTLEKKILTPLLPGFKLATFQSWAWHSYQHAIPVSAVLPTTQAAELKLQGFQGDRQIITNQGYYQVVCWWLSEIFHIVFLALWHQPLKQPNSNLRDFREIGRSLAIRAITRLCQWLSEIFRIVFLALWHHLCM